MFRRNTQHKSGPPQVSKILGIQFSILSPEEITQGSVVEVTSKDMYANNRPCHGGLFDPRMGVLDPGLICPTDGMDYMMTPGYFAPLRSCSAKLSFVFIMSTRMCVISSSLRCCPSIRIDGRTAGGGIAST